MKIGQPSISLLSANEKQFVSYVRKMSACLRSVFFIAHPKHAEMSMDEKKREVSRLCASLERQSMMFVKKSTECTGWNIKLITVTNSNNSIIYFVHPVKKRFELKRIDAALFGKYECKLLKIFALLDSTN